MRLIKTATILCLSCLGAIASTSLKPAAAQTGINPHTDEVYDTSHCLLYNNAYVDSYGNVTCSMSPSGSSGYYYH